MDAGVLDGGLEMVRRVSSLSLAVSWAKRLLNATFVLCRNPAVVFDIDGTLINNRSESSKCIRPLVALARECAEAGIVVFAITARPESKGNRARTVSQISECNVVVKALYMQPPGSQYAQYKYDAREKIRTSGYTILLSVGDQFPDLSPDIDATAGLDDAGYYIGKLGDHGGYGLKLPIER